MASNKANVEIHVSIDPKVIQAVTHLAYHLDEAVHSLLAAANDMEYILTGKSDEEKFSLHYRWNMIKAKLLRPYWEFRSKYTPPTCGYECDWTYPYGFVPEADCPVHDR